MKTKDLNSVPDTKGTKRGQGSNNQLANSVKMEGINTTSKVKYLQPKSDAKLSDFFNYYKQENSRQFDINMLAVSIEKKYDKYGLDFCKNLFNDAYFFTNCFNSDIVSKVDDNIDYTDISYNKGDNTITRYLVSVDNSNVVSIFNHFLQYAISSNRESVAAIIEDMKHESDEKRRVNTEKRREEKKVAETKKTIKDLDIATLLSMMSPEQIAAFKAAI